MALPQAAEDEGRSPRACCPRAYAVLGPRIDDAEALAEPREASDESIERVVSDGRVAPAERHQNTLARTPALAGKDLS